MSDKSKNKYYLCEGCKYYFNPKENVLCNSVYRCKRLVMAEIDNIPDMYEKVNKDDE